MTYALRRLHQRVTKSGFMLLLLIILVGCANVAPLAQRPATAPPAGAPSKILFVGNSFTYYNDSLHNHLRGLLGSSPENPETRIRIMTISGSHLAEHAGLEAMAASEDWDLVVLQGHSLEAYDANRIPGFFAAVRKHAATVRRHGARPVLFMTWAYTGEPEMTAVIRRNYTRIGRELDAQVVPVGLAFEKALAMEPGIPLVHPDLRHPTIAGTYLAACVFYGALFSRSPQGLKYAAGMGETQARFLQDVAWETVQSFYADD